LFLNCQLGNQLTSAQWSLFRLWQLENLKIKTFCKQHCAMASAGRTAHNLQRRGAFIAAFISEKRWMTNKKICSALVIDTEFFHKHLPILVRYKTKGAVGAVCALLCNWQLGA
jgi:hypothetical protein